MGKYFDILMAGILTGLTGVTTAMLGIGGTVIGAISSSMIHQTFSAYIKDPFKDSKVKQFEQDVVYLIPLIVIEIIVALFIIGYFNYAIKADFYFLEYISHRFLFRIIGIGLLIMGIFSSLKSSIIKNRYSKIMFYVGLVLFIRAILDLFPGFTDTAMRNFDIVFFSIIFIVLAYLIVKIFIECVDLYMNFGNKAIDTSYIGKNDLNDEIEKVCYKSRNIPSCEYSFTVNRKKIDNLINEYEEKPKN